MATFITRFASRSSDGGVPGGTGALRLAIKDLIDMEGVATTAGCKAVADRARPAPADAACLTEIRASEAAGRVSIVGKTNLHELAMGVTGINPWFGTPVNPADAALVPGGSSSGSGVAVGWGDADVALGTDTGGSVRIPAACCGVAGLKTTWGRVSLDGVWPLAPSLDTVGPMARDVAGLLVGMQLLEPGFELAGEIPLRVGRLRLPGDHDIDAAIDRALSLAELDVSEVRVPGWARAHEAAMELIGAEAWQANGRLAREHPEGIDPALLSVLEFTSGITPRREALARQAQTVWQGELATLFESVQVLALPTMEYLPPPVSEPRDRPTLTCTVPVNFAGVPALALPIPMAVGHLNASLQLVGPSGSEEELLALGARVERAVAR